MAFEFTYVKGGGVPRVKLYPAKASEVIKKGLPLNLESGLACVGAAADTAFIGIANETKTPTADGQLVEVIECNQDTVFRCPVDATGTKKTLTNADIGTAFDLGATNVGIIDLDDTTGGGWVLVDFEGLTAYVICSSAKRAVTVV